MNKIQFFLSEQYIDSIMHGATIKIIFIVLIFEFWWLLLTFIEKWKDLHILCQITNFSNPLVTPWLKLWFYWSSSLNSPEFSLCKYNMVLDFIFNPYPTAFPYGNGMVLHFYQQQESSTTKTVHKVINKRLKTYV